MHRVAAPLLVALVSLALVACGGNGSDKSSKDAAANASKSALSIKLKP